MKYDGLNILYDDDIAKSMSSNRDKVAQIKFNPFKYCPNADSILIIDGSHQIISRVDPLFNFTESFIKVKEHPSRECIQSELTRWQVMRGLPHEQADKFNTILSYDPQLKSAPIYEGCAISIKVNAFTKRIMSSIIDMLKMCKSSDTTWFMSNQIVLSYILAKFNIPIEIFNADSYFYRYKHGCYQPI